MKLAVVSDIHGNLEALEAVLSDSAQAGAGSTVSLGDNIGYGPDAERVVTCLRRRAIPSVMGNHELAIADPKFLEWFNSAARESLQKTVPTLSAASLEFITGLPAARVDGPCRFVHGFPPDQITPYLFHRSKEQLFKAFEQMNERICFVGHTHHLELVTFDGHSVQRERLSEGTLRLQKDRQYIINAGSVGQPRDGNNTAKYLLWDADQNTLTVRFVPYDHIAVAVKIVTCGLPAVHARRLY